MKKSLMIFAASTIVLFAACNKEENKGYTINGDKITFGVGVTDPQDEGKQTYSGSDRLIFFNAGDQIDVNGTVYSVNPIATSNYAGSTNTNSPVANVTCNIAADGAYAFTYPANIFTNEGGVYRATYPKTVLALNGFNTTNIDAIREAIRPIWPMYYRIPDVSNFHNMVELKNASAFLSPAVLYGPSWANVVFGPLTGATYGEVEGQAYNPCPTMNILDGVIYSSLKLHGVATLNTTDNENPIMVMNETVSGRYDTLSWGAPANTVIQEDVSSQQEHVTIVGIIPIAPVENMASKTFKMAVSLNATIDGQTYYMLYVTDEKTTRNALMRNNRYFMNFDFQSVGTGLTPNYTYEGGVQNYVDNNGGHISFDNHGDLYVCNNLTDFRAIINRLNIYPL